MFVFKKTPQLSYKEVIFGLKKLGFYKRKNKSTAHEQWVCDLPFRKVTVDKHTAPFDEFLEIYGETIRRKHERVLPSL